MLIFICNAGETIMKNFKAYLTLLIAFLFSSTAFAASKITLSDVHLCCPTCKKAVETAVGGIKDADVKVDLVKKTVTVTANDDAVAQKAVDAIASAGFYGSSGNDKVAIKTPGAEGTSSNADLVGFHNCCVGCEYSIKSGVNEVDGVDSTVVKKRSCNVKGSFDVAAVLKAANDAGFSASVKK